MAEFRRNLLYSTLAVVGLALISIHQQGLWSGLVQTYIMLVFLIVSLFLILAWAKLLHVPLRHELEWKKILPPLGILFPLWIMAIFLLHQRNEDRILTGGGIFAPVLISGMIALGLKIGIPKKRSL